MLKSTWEDVSDMAAFDEWVHFRTTVRIKDVSSFDSLAKIEDQFLFWAETEQHVTGNRIAYMWNQLSAEPAQCMILVPAGSSNQLDKRTFSVVRSYDVYILVRTTLFRLRSSQLYFIHLLVLCFISWRRDFSVGNKVVDVERSGSLLRRGRRIQKEDGFVLYSPLKHYKHVHHLFKSGFQLVHVEVDHKGVKCSGSLHSGSTSSSNQKRKQALPPCFSVFRLLFEHPSVQTSVSCQTPFALIFAFVIWVYEIFRLSGLLCVTNGLDPLEEQNLGTDQ
ncbi:hypothetical protein F511_39163 [Dorcoceras hygrometricum]|uniref:Uncharacterized protein n=1 Tax=Dorcoceras hygrometricum TaxID=472368 RepID=A0A2Z7A7P0_9LAMI|nr:hypothetical protein F511_39163 [Dorcoceras hygrometricum]